MRTIPTAACEIDANIKPRAGQSDWPTDNSRKVRWASMPATASNLPPMQEI